MNKPVIVDLFDSIVTAVSVAYGQTVHFQHGHMKEIVNVTAQLARDPDISKRYPMIALRHDIPFEVEPMKGIRFDCTLYIITLSRPEYVAAQRMETIFKPLLYPIRDELINQIARSGYFEQSTIDQVDAVAEYIDRLFWGSSTVMGNESNIFNDWVDAIEINLSGLVAFMNCASVSPALGIVSIMTNDTGEYFYVTCNQQMAAVVPLLPAQFLWYVGGASVAFDTAELLSDGKTYKLKSEAPAEYGTDITMQIFTGVIQSAKGVLMPAYNNLLVVNNVQL